LLAEWAIDAGLARPDAQDVGENPDISEVWLRSSGGYAEKAAMKAGLVIRGGHALIITRIPHRGWTCFSSVAICRWSWAQGPTRRAGAHFMSHVTMTTISNCDQYTA